MQMLNEVAFAVSRNTVPEDKVMHPAANVYRVDLHEPMVGQRCPYARERCVQG